MALSANKKISTVPDITFRDIPVASGAIHIYKSALINRNISGFGVLGDDTVNKVFTGVAYEELNQAVGGSDGDNKVKVISAHSGTTVKLTLAGVTKSNIGKDCFVLSDDAVALAGVPTVEIRVGTIIDTVLTNEALVILD